MADRALVFNCSCGAIVCLPNKTALALVEASGACHKCRLAKTVEHLMETSQVDLLADVLRFSEGYEGFRVAPPFPDMTMGEWIALGEK